MNAVNSEILINNDSYFSFSNITESDVVLAIKKVKSDAIGTDEISLKFLKIILPMVLPAITDIFNASLTKSYFKVLPLPKKMISTNLYTVGAIKGV